jgi:WXG100 family type VII secretion target
MSEIQVTSSTLRSKAEELNQLNEQFRNAVTSLTDEENALRSQYEGESSDAFHSAFTQDTVQMSNFYNAIAQYVQKLTQIAETYEKAEQTNVATATTRNY